MTRRPDEALSITLDAWTSRVFRRAQLAHLVRVKSLSPRDGNCPSQKHTLVNLYLVGVEEKSRGLLYGHSNYPKEKGSARVHGVLLGLC